MSIRTPGVWRTAPLAIALALPGCLALERENPEIRRYALDAERPDDRARSASPRGSLLVAGLDDQLASGGEMFLYRLEGSRYQSDFYHRFLVAPAEQISTLTAAWLQEAGLFGVVFRRENEVAPDFSLRGALTSLYADDRGEPHAVLEVQYYLLALEGSPPTAPFHRRYLQRVGIKDHTPEALVAGWNQALGAVLTNLERDLAAFLGETSP